MRLAARVCLASLTLAMALGCGRRSLGVTCTYNGRQYAANSTISQDACGLCVCTDDGQVRCTAHACPVSLDASTQDGAGQSLDATTDVGADAVGGDTRHDGAGGGIGDMCWSNGDCVPPPFTVPPPPFCLAPDGTATVDYGCPFCLIPDTSCGADGDCASQGPTSICVVDACTCNNAKSCVRGCGMDADCAVGKSCGADHRCAPSACGAGAPACPTDFVCGAGQTCQRRPCTDDTECSSACVIGKCFDHPGRCAPVPI